MLILSIEKLIGVYVLWLFITIYLAKFLISSVSWVNMTWPQTHLKFSHSCSLRYNTTWLPVTIRSPQKERRKGKCLSKDSYVDAFSLLLPSSLLWFECLCYPNIHILKSDHTSDSEVHERMGPLEMMRSWGVDAFVKVAHGAHSPLAAYGDPMRRHHLWTRKPSLDRKSVVNFMVSFWAFRMMRNRSLVFIRYPFMPSLG
jgi:hypothetical protein